MGQKQILLVPNPQRDAALKATASAAKILSSAGAKLYCTVSLPEVQTVSPEQGAAMADAAVVFGGDGTILRFSHLAAAHELPVIGVNLGTLGYMTEIGPDCLNLLPRMLTDDFITESRMMLSVAVLRREQPVFCADALNDAVVTYGTLPHLVSFTLYDSGSPFAAYRADGMVFSTPTGSTAYSLSAGGPIVDPRLDAIVTTPISAHSLSARPMVFSAQAQLRLVITSQRKGDAYLTVDGDRGIPLETGDSICVTRSEKIMRLIRFANEPFGKTLATKLNENKFQE